MFDKRRRDKHCCEKLKQIPYPKFRDRESVKAFHNNVDCLVYLPVCSLRLSQTVMKKVYDEPQKSLKEVCTAASSRREQVSGKPKSSFHFKVSLLCTL